MTKARSPWRSFQGVALCVTLVAGVAGGAYLARSDVQPLGPDEVGNAQVTLDFQTPELITDFASSSEPSAEDQLNVTEPRPTSDSSPVAPEEDPLNNLIG